MSTSATKGETQIVEPSVAERAIARRAAEARATVPDLELRADVDMSASLAACEAHGCSTAALLVAACGAALREVPRANAAYRDGRFELYSRVNVGFVVATEQAYLIPTVFDADAKSFAELSAELEYLSAAALAGELPPPAYSGATCTLSDVGALGVPASTIVVSPPQAAAVAAGAIRQAPVVRAGEVVAAPLLTLTVACDHRILYGAHAAAFLARLTDTLGAPQL